jgi:hypothetical protein
VRFPVEDLVRWGRQNLEFGWHVNRDHHADGRNQRERNLIRTRVGVTERQWQDREAEGLDFWEADEWAVRAYNVPPWRIWPEWERCRDNYAEPVETPRFASRQMRYRARERLRRSA